MVEKRKVIKLLLVLVIFIFAAFLRLWNIDKMGRTWDEDSQVELGYKFIKLIENRDFSNNLWQYPYHPPLTKYLYGWAAQYDVTGYKDGKPIFNYDWTNARLTSVLFSSLTAVLIVLIGWSYLSLFIGTISSIIFSMLPFMLGLSQLATIESILIFFFTASVYSFLNFLRKMTLGNAILTGILVGLALETKYTNILLIPLFLWIYVLWYFYKNKKKNFFNVKILIIPIAAFLTFFVLWPMPWFHLKEIFEANYKMRIADASHSIPEVFFGRLMFVPKLYYAIEFLITTPFIILVLFAIGLKNISNKKTWIMYTLVIWFVFPFIQSFYNFRQHGIRYIIEIYVPLSLIAGIGFNYLLEKFTKKILIKFIFFIPVFIYMLVVLFRITPYYLNYFNIVVGGAKNVYEKKLFQLGWWGEGGREAALYLKISAPKESTIGVAHEPFASIPKINNLKIEPYKENKKYDYVIVGFFHIIRHGFDDSKIRKDYVPVYSVVADGAHIMKVYKKK